MSTTTSFKTLPAPASAATSSTNKSNSTSQNSTGATSTSSAVGGYALKPADFIKLMVTELQNQDPTKPASSQDLLTQMSQIGSLQSSTSLQDTLTSFGLQSTISSAGNLIGKSVTGLDDKGKELSGTVTSVKVKDKKAYLQLDSGSELQVGNVTAIKPSTPSTTTATATGTPAAATKTGTPAATTKTAA